MDEDGMSPEDQAAKMAEMATQLEGLRQKVDGLIHSTSHDLNFTAETLRREAELQKESQEREAAIRQEASQREADVRHTGYQERFEKLSHAIWGVNGSNGLTGNVRSLMESEGRKVWRDRLIISAVVVALLSGLGSALHGAFKNQVAHEVEASRIAQGH